MRILFCLAAFLAVAQAQPRTLELFGQIGRSRLGGDEGSPGSGTAYGGAVMVPVTSGWAVDVDIMHARTEADGPPPEVFHLNRTLISPALIRRWGTERLYGFAGGGVGIQRDSSRSTYYVYGPGDPPERMLREAANRDTGMTLLGKTGIVVSPAERFLIRADLILAFRYVLPTVGARVGVGFRF